LVFAFTAAVENDGFFKGTGLSTGWLVFVGMEFQGINGRTEFTEIRAGLVGGEMWNAGVWLE
jgi:hypothetical protein